MATRPLQAALPMSQAVQLSVWVSLIPMNPITNVQGSRLRKSAMHKMVLRVLYRMFLSPRAILLKSIYRMFLSHRAILLKSIWLRSYGLTCGSSRATLGTHHGPIKIIRHRCIASTSGLDPVTLCIHRRPLPLTYIAMEIINCRCSSHYCWSSRRHLAGHLDLMRHPINSSTTGVEPDTLGIHSNSLPATHIHMARPQAMATTISINSSFALFNCLPIQCAVNGPRAVEA